MVTALKKSQIIAEFVIMVSLAMIFAIIFITAISQNKGLYQTKEVLWLKDIALKIQDEVSITSYAENGYSRQFKLPSKIDNNNYNISIRNNTLIIWTNTTSYITAILNVTGYLKKDSNTITKVNGITYVNQ